MIEALNQGSEVNVCTLLQDTIKLDDELENFGKDITSFADELESLLTGANLASLAESR